MSLNILKLSMYCIIIPYDRNGAVACSGTTETLYLILKYIYVFLYTRRLFYRIIS